VTFDSIPKSLKMSAERRRKFGKISEAVEGFYFVISTCQLAYSGLEETIMIK
jgi:hypothetical protein